MKTEGTLIYHKITVATGLLQNNAYELVLFCLIIPCARCLFVFYFYKKCKWLFWFCVHRHRSMYPASRGPSIFLGKSGRSKGLCSQGTVDAIDRAINRSDCNRSMYAHWMQSQILSSFLQWHLAIKTSIFLLLVFVLLFLYRVEVATLVLRPSRSIDQSIGCYKSSIRVDYKVRSRVVFSGNI